MRTVNKFRLFEAVALSVGIGLTLPGVVAGETNVLVLLFCGAVLAWLVSDIAKDAP